MPVGAVSNPVRVPGGYEVVQMQGTHAVGTDIQTTVSMRQTFVPYPTPITNGQVGPAQGAVITKLVQAGHNVHSCSDMEALNTEEGKTRPADPGPVNLADVTPPAFQAILANLPIGQVSQPLVAPDGVSIVMVCSRRPAQSACLPTTTSPMPSSTSGCRWNRSNCSIISATARSSRRISKQGLLFLLKSSQKRLFDLAASALRT